MLFRASAVIVVAILAVCVVGCNPPPAPPSDDVTISCLTPNPCNQSSVTFLITWKKSMTGGSTSNFSMDTTGVTGASITGISGSGYTRILTVNTGSGDGTIRVSLANSTGLTDDQSNPSPLFYDGELLTIDKSTASVSSITRMTAETTKLDEVVFKVTFSEGTLGGSASNFSLTTSGVSGASIVDVLGNGIRENQRSNLRYVLVNTGTGNTGSIKLNLANSAGLTDWAGNSVSAYSSGETYTVSRASRTGQTLTSQTFTTTQSFSNLDYVYISGCTFQNITGNGAVNFYNVGDVKVQDCTFTNVYANDGYGTICGKKCQNVDIIGCNITHSTRGCAIIFPMNHITAGDRTTNLTVDDCTITDITGDGWKQGIFIYQTDVARVRNSEISYAGYGIGTAYATTADSDVNAAHYYNNYIHHVLGENIGCQDYAWNVKIEGNELAYPAYDGYGGRACELRDSGCGDHNIYWCGAGVHIVDNYFHHNMDLVKDGTGLCIRTNGRVERNILCEGRGPAMSYFDDHSSDNTGVLTIVNNVMYNNAEWGFSANGSAGGVEVTSINIYHNTIVTVPGTERGLGAYQPLNLWGFPGWTPVRITCNILNYETQTSENTYYVSLADGCFYRVGRLQGQNILTPYSYTEASIFQDKANDNYHLKSGSPAIDGASLFNWVSVDAEGNARSGTDDIGAYEYTVSGPAPTLSNISPTSGTTAGGTACTLTGSNMTGTYAVSFGGTAATGVTTISASEVRCVSPAKSAGAISVTATNGGGTSNGVTYTFTAPTPTLSSIAPASGTTAGGTACTLTGTGLIGTTGVSFGGTAATGITVDSATQVRCTSPAKSAGSVSVTATTAGGTSNGVTYTYTAGGGGSTSTLTSTKDCYVYSYTGGGWGNVDHMDTFSTTAHYSYAFMAFDISGISGDVTSAKIRLCLQSNTNYSWNLSAYSVADDTWAETIQWAQKPAHTTPALDTISGTRTQNNWYEWNVTSFVDAEVGASAAAVSFMITDSSATGGYAWEAWYTRESANDPQLVVVTGGGGGTPVPALSSIAPAAGTTAGGTACTLTGTDLTGCSAVSFGGTAATGIVVDSSTQVRCTSPEKSAGACSVTATTSGGTSNGVTFNYIAPPTLSSINPTSGGTSGNTLCTLTGTNLNGATDVSFGGTTAEFTVDNETTIRCLSPAKSAGGCNVTVTTQVGTSNSVTFTYYSDVPTLSSLSPSSGTTAGGTSVTLTGTNLTGCSAVSFGGTAATGIVVDSATQVRCTSPAKSAGTISVTATTPGGTSNGVNYIYVASAPTLSGISPASGTTAGGTACTLTGTNLTGCSAVSFGGTAATGIVVDSATQVRCTSPAKSAGTISVTATTGNGTSNGVNYVYVTPAPTLSGIVPASGTTAGGTACTLTGTNLTGCSAVSFGGTAGTGIVVDSATQVRCTSPAKSAGTISVTATTPGGTSNGVNYVYVTPVPTLSGIAPSSGTTAGGTACTLTGTNLTGCSAVSFGGTAGTGIVVDSATQVRCTSPAKSAGTYSVTATTPGGTSNGVNYVYTAGGGGTTLLTDGFETNFDKWTDGGTTDWTRTTGQKKTGSYSATAGPSSNDLFSDNLNASTYGSMTIEFWYRDDDIDSGDGVALQLFDGTAYDNYFNLNLTTEDTWTFYTVTINNSGADAQYFISNFRIKFEATGMGNGENLWVDDVNVIATGSAPPPAPTLSAISPTSGTTAGGTSCTLTGTNLTGCTAVSFGGTAATGIVVDSATQVRCTSPAKAAGTYSVTATTPGGTSNGVNYTYTGGGGTTTTYTLAAIHDSYVDGWSGPDTTHGSEATMRIQWPGNYFWGLVKFDLSGVDDTDIQVLSATLKLHANWFEGSPVTIELYEATSDSWTESAVTWNNKPAKDTTLVASTTCSSGVGIWYQWSVASCVTSELATDDALSLYVINTGGYNTHWDSKESAYAPTLEIVMVH